MLYRILRDDWSDYDAKKTQEKSDKLIVSCDNRWEITFISKLIKNHYPLKSQYLVNAAVRACCASAETPVHRSAFLSCVIKRLAYK